MPSNLPPTAHIIFDMIAVLTAILSGFLVYKWRFQSALPETTGKIGIGYFFALSLGSITGAFLFGTLNLQLSGIEQIGRSILGALFGAICTVELYKLKRGTTGSTGYIYIIPFSVSVIIGRIGCFFSGLHDNTHGIPTTASWGWDYGDQVLRHPVQIYESLSMLCFLVIVLAILWKHHHIIIRYGFYLCVGFYAFQRFIWEFYKPYGDFVPPLNIFQVLCLIIIVYSAFMITKAKINDSIT